MIEGKNWVKLSLKEKCLLFFPEYRDQYAKLPESSFYWLEAWVIRVDLEAEAHIWAWVPKNQPQIFHWVKTEAKI